MVRKCAAELLLLALVGHVAAGIVDPDSIQHDDDEPKFVEGTFERKNYKQFVKHPQKNYKFLRNHNIDFYSINLVIFIFMVN